jgi:hypothetical protein
LNVELVFLILPVSISFVFSGIYSDSHGTRGKRKVVTKVKMQRTFAVGFGAREQNLWRVGQKGRMTRD